MATIIPFTNQTQAQRFQTITDAKILLTNLGQQISQCIKSYNDLKQQLMKESDNPIKAQIDDLLERRRAAIQALIDAHKADIEDFKNKLAVTDGGNIVTTPEPPAQVLAGIGQLDQLSALQTQIQDQQTKLTALNNYFSAYKAAISAGQQPPAIPPELQEGVFGLSAGLLAAGVALVAGIYMFGKK